MVVEFPDEDDDEVDGEEAVRRAGGESEGVELMDQRSGRDESDEVRVSEFGHDGEGGKDSDREEQNLGCPCHRL